MAITNTIPVVPLCPRQLRDVRQEDILFGGLARKCDTYRGGGGYDKFNDIYTARFGKVVLQTQFVVQTYGCPFSCPYCYVTPEGIWGDPVYVPEAELLRMYRDTSLDVFHLMGGAPAQYLSHWPALSNAVTVFHSDFLLVEQVYDPTLLSEVAGLHAVSFKTFTPDTPLVARNIEALLNSNISFYVTFTGEPVWRERLIARYGKAMLKDSFVIPIQRYSALEEDNI